MPRRLIANGKHRQDLTTPVLPNIFYDSDSARSGPDNKKKPRTCADCNKEFRTTYTLNRHRNTAHETTTTFTCRIAGCNQTFARRDVYDRHVDGQHGGGKVPCDKCGRLVRKDGMRDHQATKTCQDLHAIALRNVNIAHHRPTPSASSPGTVISHNSRTPGHSPFIQDHAYDGAHEPPTPYSPSGLEPNAAPLFDSGAVEDFNITQANQMSTRFQTQARAPSVGNDVSASSSSHPTNWTDPMLVDHDMPFGYLDPEMRELRRIASRVSRIGCDVPEDVDELWRSEKIMKAVKNDNGLAPFLIQGALRSYKELSLIGFGSQCPLCAEALGVTTDDVIKHAKQHFQQRNLKTFLCNGCGIDFVYMRDLRFHQNSSGMCDCNRTSNGSSSLDAHTESESWVEDKFEADRDQYVESLRRWELLQLQWYVSSISKFSKKVERSKGKHTTAPARIRKLSNASRDSATKIKHRLVQEGLGLQLKIRSEIRHGSLSDVDIAAVFRNFSLKNRLIFGRKSTAKNGLGPVNGILPSPTLSRRPREDSLVQACGAGDLDQARVDLERLRQYGALTSVERAVVTASNAGHNELVNSLMMDTANTLRGPHSECVEAEKQSRSRACFYHRNAGHLYMALLNALFSLGRRKLIETFDVPCERHTFELLSTHCKHNDSPMITCAVREELEAIEYLIRIGVPVDWCLNSSGTTALHAASSVGRTEVVELLMNYHANFDRPDSLGLTPLMHAVDGGHSTTVKLLLSRGATTTCAYSVSECVCPQLLKDSAIDIGVHRNDQNETLLLRLCRTDDASTALVTTLLEADIDIDALDRQGKTALHWACMRGRIDIARRLLESGARIGTRDDAGATPLLVVLKESTLATQSSMISFLISEGAEVNARDEACWTPLHWAVYGGKCAEAETLLRRGADINAMTDEYNRSDEGPVTGFPLLTQCARCSPLSMASLIDEPEAHQKMVSLLMKRGANWQLASRLLHE